MARSRWLSMLQVVSSLVSSLVVLGGCSAGDGAALQNENGDDVEISEQEWTQANRTAAAAGLGFLRGHEDLTRFAVDEANELVRAREPKRFTRAGAVAFPRVKVGDYGYSSANPLVQGNFASDVAIEMWPFQATRHDELLAFYGSQASSLTEWQEAPDLQSLHFLRDMKDGKPLALGAACKAGRGRMVAATKKALDVSTRDPQRGLFWAGHVLHIVQDAFSPAHAQRASAGTRGRTSDFKRIVDICSYGAEFEGVCKHAEPVLDAAVVDADRIWTVAGSFTWSRDRKYLVPEAEAAVKASAGYLVVFDEMATKRARGEVVDVEASLARLFDTEIGARGAKGSLHDHSGFFVCPK